MPDGHVDVATEMSIEELTAHIAAEAKNLAMEEVGEMIADGIKRGHAEWEKKSQSQRSEHERAAFKKALFAGTGARREVTDGIRKRFVTKADDVEVEFDGMQLAKALPFIVKARNNQDMAVDLAQKAGLPDVVRTLQASDFSGGGALIDEPVAADFIGFRYNRSAVRRLGASVIDISAGALTIGRQNTPAIAYWVDENERIQVSEGTYGQLRLSAKKLGVLVPISNDLMRRTPAGFAALVRDDMGQVAVVAEDSAMIRGSGSEARPKGIREWTTPSNRFGATSSATLADVTRDLLRAQYLVERTNVPMTRMGWMMHPRSKFFLMSLRSNDGYHVFLDQMSAGRLYGEPFATTKNIPNNLGVGGDEAEIYFGDFSQVVIGETLNLEVDEFNGGVYVDSNGNTLSGIQRDFTLARLIHEMDMVVRYDDAFAIIEAVTWGASFDA